MGSSRIFYQQGYRITQNYSSSHEAVDLVPENGSSTAPITAHSDGTVVFFQDGIPNAQGSTGNRSYGNCIKLKHDNGYYTLYAHMSKLLVKNRQSVKKGQQIGLMGNTGNSYGAHLHFEVRNASDNNIDPTKYLNADLPGLTTSSSTSSAVEAAPYRTSDSKLLKFIQVAEEHGANREDRSWVERYINTGGQDWCAYFVTACAMVAEVANVIITKESGAGDFARHGVPKGWGVFYPGPWHNQYPTPQPGDIVTFKWNSRSYWEYQGKDQYYADHVAIVISVSGSSFKIAEGNNSNRTAIRTFSINADCVNGYYRPNWVQVDGYYAVDIVPISTVETLTEQKFVRGLLYDTINTEKDAVAREVAYLDSSNKPSINPSNIRLSTVNYTTLLNWFHYLLGYGTLYTTTTTITTTSMSGGSLPTSAQQVSYDVSGLSNSVARRIAEFFIGKGFNRAAVAGILANAYHESSFEASSDTWDIDAPGGGLWGWYNKNFSAMKSYVGSGWQSNVTGQCEFLWYDMTLRSGSYFNDVIDYQLRLFSAGFTSGGKGFVEFLKSLPDTAEGANKAGKAFMAVYENPADHSQSNTNRRGSTAVDFYNKLVALLKPSSI